MKTKTILILAILIISISCKKYEEGPLLSLRTKKSRLCGEWEIEKISGDPSVYIKKTERNPIIFKKNSDFSYSEIIYLTVVYDENEGAVTTEYNINYDGSWSFIDNKNKIELSYEYDSVIYDYSNGIYSYKTEKANDNRILNIKRLTNEDFWYSFEESNSNEISHELKKKKQ